MVRTNEESKQNKRKRDQGEDYRWEHEKHFYIPRKKISCWAGCFPTLWDGQVPLRI